MQKIWMHLWLRHGTRMLLRLLMILQSVVSTRKMNLLKYVQGMDTKDCRLYRQLLENLNIFLGVKDSIRLLNIQEEMVKKDLMQCIQDNWKTRRNLNVGSGGNKQ